MAENDQKSEHERICDLEEQMAAINAKGFPGISEVASLVNYKLAEFVRLEGARTLGSTPLLPFLPPLDLSTLFATITTFAKYLTESDRVKAKVQAILDTIQPPDPGDLDLPVPPPVPPTPGTQKMRQALEVIEAAKQAAENLEPESARDSLKEAKDLMKDPDVRREFRRLRAARSWYDILEELQAMIDYLDGVSK